MQMIDSTVHVFTENPDFPKNAPENLQNDRFSIVFTHEHIFINILAATAPVA